MVCEGGFGFRGIPRQGRVQARGEPFALSVMIRWFLLQLYCGMVVWVAAELLGRTREGGCISLSEMGGVCCNGGKS